MSSHRIRIIDNIYDEVREINQLIADGALGGDGNGNGNGNITSVVAGEGLAGGGNTGDVTLSIQNNGVTENKIRDAAVTGDKIAPDAVTELKIQDAAVTGDKIQNNGVTENKIRDAAVTGDKIQNNAVTELKIRDAAVTGDKIQNNAVTENKIRDAAVTGDKIAPDAVTELKIRDAAVTQVKIAPNAVTSTQIQDGAVTFAKLADAAVVTEENGGLIGDQTDLTLPTSAAVKNYVDTNQLNLGNGLNAENNDINVNVDDISIEINNNELRIKDDGVTQDKIAANAVTFAKIQNIPANTVVVGNANSEGPLTTQEVANTELLIGNGNGFNAEPLSGDVTMTNDGAVTIAAAAVTEAKIQDRAVTEDKIAANAVTTAKIGDNQVTFEKIADGAVITQENGGLVNVQDNTLPTSEAVKTYVDGVASGLDVVAPCRVATTENITRSDTQTIDGVNIVAGNRVLVKDQTNAAENGIYVCVANGAWTRAADFDDAAEVTAGAFTFIEEGTASANNGFVLTTPGTITVGTTALTFSQFSAAGQIIAGNGLSKTGNTFAVNVDNISIEISADDLRIKDGGVTEAKIGNSQVTEAKIAANAVTEVKIAANAVTNAKIATNAVTNAKIATDAVTETKIAANAVTRLQIQDGEVINGKIADGAVTEAKIGDSQVTNGKIADDAVTQLKIAANAVTNAKIATDAVTQLKIAANAVTNAKIATDAVTNAKIVDGAVTTTKIGNSQVTEAKIGDSQVTETKIAANAVTNAKIAANAVNRLQIATDAVTETKIAANAVTRLQIQDGEVINGKIADGAVTEAKIGNSQVTETKIAANAVTRLQIQDGEVINGKIADGAVTEAKIGNSQVTETKIAANAVTRLQIQDGEVINGKIADGAVTEAKIGDSQVTETKIAANAVTNAKIAANAVNRLQIATDAVTETKIAANAVTRLQIQDGEVINGKIADGAVTEAKIGNSQVTTAKIGNSQVTFAKLADAAVITAAEGLANNNNDTTLPTSAAVKDYVDTNLELITVSPEVTDTSCSLVFVTDPTGTLPPKTNTGLVFDSSNATLSATNIAVGEGQTLDVSDGTLTLADDQISGDKVNNGTIDSITISQLAGAMDCNNQSMTNVNIDGGAIDATTIGATTPAAGTFTTLNANSDTVVGGTLNIGEQQDIPTRPGNGEGGLLYSKDDGKIYWLSHEIDEFDLTSTGGGGGAITSVTNGQDNRIATFSGTTSLNGEATLTYDGTTFAVATDKFTVASGTGNTAVAGNLAVDTDKFTVASDTGKVGVGTDEPGTVLQIDSTAPYLTLKNTTPENGEGECESRIIFEDHADASLAVIEASHEGTADDTRGQLTFSTHNGTDLVENVIIDGNGDIVMMSDPNDPSNATLNLLGDIIQGDASAFSLFNVSLNNDGTKIAIGMDTTNSTPGIVKVYQLSTDNTTWNQLGQTINGTANGDRFGHSVSLSSDGSRVAIGAPQIGSSNSRGYVEVYQLSTDNTTWEKLGQTINGAANLDQLGYSVSLSSNGSRVAIGAPQPHTIFPQPNGYGEVYQLSTDNTTTTWEKLGQTIDGGIRDGRFGGSVSLNGDGSVVAVAAYRGESKVFILDNTTWTQRGQILNSFLGSIDSLSLSNDGERLALGDLFGEGQVQAIKFDNGSGEWIPLGNSINGEATFSRFGMVSLSNDGNRMVVGTRTSSGISKFYAYQYDSRNNLWNSLGQPIEGLNRFGTAVSISGDGERMCAFSETQGDTHIYEVNFPTTNSTGIKITTNSINIPDEPLEIISRAGSHDLLKLTNTASTGRSTLLYDTIFYEWEIGARGDNLSPINSFYIHKRRKVNNAAEYSMIITENNKIGFNTSEYNTINTNMVTMCTSSSATSNGVNFLACYNDISPSTSDGRWILRWAGGSGNYNVEVIMFRGNNEVRAGWFENDSDAERFDFTGQHRSLMNKNYTSESIGLIVSSDGKYVNMDNSLNPKINESLPYCLLSIVDNDKKVFGVISEKETEDYTRGYGVGYIAVIDRANTNEQRMIVNSVGEGAIWVCNKNGTFENGDYITTTTVPGYGGKQADDILHSYTVAKITCDCDFSLTKIAKQIVKVFKTTDETGNTTTSIEYDANGDVQYEDDLDENGNQQMEYPFETRFLASDGTRLADEAEYTTRLGNGEAVYIACFVGCTYHCG